MIPFNIPSCVGNELDYIKQAIASKKICGDGSFTKKCHSLLENRTGCEKVLLTTSCSHALEMSALLTNIKPGDEVIMPSYTFVSTANAFVLRGAVVVFVDIRPDTMNIDENLIESAITEKTKAIVPVHYAGVGCEMDKIMSIAKKYNLYVVEDTAQGVMAYYKNRALGSIGDIGCYSFHETKNYSMGEGGAVLVNNPDMYERSEIIREKGTNRSRFLRGQVDKYTWVDEGSSYLPSDINAAYLCAQLEKADEINENRLSSWKKYYDAFSALENGGYVECPFIPDECRHNAHMFYLKVKDITQRTQLISYLKENEIMAVFHYVPLHSSQAGVRFGRFNGEDKYTTKESERLLRLPMYYGLTDNEIDYVVEKIKSFFGK